MNDAEKAKKILKEENLTCVILKGDTVYKSRKRGVAPIIELIDSNTDLKNFCVADKIIGKAAALLFALCEIERIFSPTISEPAVKILEKFNIEYKCEKIVPYIINRTGDGQCPMERAVADTDSPREALIKIKEKIKELRKNIEAELK